MVKIREILQRDVIGKINVIFSGSLQETRAGCQAEISKADLLSEMLWEHGAAEEQRITVT